MSSKTIIEILKETPKVEDLCEAFNKHPLYMPNLLKAYKKNKPIDRDEQQQGNMYEYENIQTKEIYALQRFEFKIENCNQDRTFLAQTLNEFQNLIYANKALQSKVVMEVHGFFFEKRQTNFYLYILLEKVENNLQNILSERKINKTQFSFTEVKQFTEQMLQILSIAQQNNFSLTELIPKNIYFVKNRYGDRQYKLIKFHNSHMRSFNVKNHPQQRNKAELFEAPEITFFKQLKDTKKDIIDYDAEKASVYSLGITLLNFALIMEYPNRPQTEIKHNPLELLNCGLGPDDLQWCQNLQTNLEVLRFMYKKEEKITLFSNIIKAMLSYCPSNRPSSFMLDMTYKAYFKGFVTDYAAIKICIQQVAREDVQLTQDERNHGPSNIVGQKIIGQAIKVNEKVTERIRELGEYNFKEGNQITTDYTQSVELGAYKLRNGCLYIGYWYKGKQNGKGKLIYPDGSLFEGFFTEGLIDGYGRMIYTDGEYYTGQWSSGKMHGLGKKVYKDGMEYNGSWDANQRHGLGRETWKNGSKYEGDFVKGMKQGKGTFKWANGNTYQGDFKDDQINGIGIYIWADKKYYKGNWKDNQMHGKGILQWPDGKTYEGEFAHDQQSGYGVFTWEDKRTYKGQWKNGKYHGEGSFYSSTGVLEKKGLYQNGDLIKWL